MKIPYPFSTLTEQWSCDHYAWALKGETFPYWAAHLSIDPIDHFWEMLGSNLRHNSYQITDTQLFVEKMSWMWANGIHFFLQFEAESIVCEIPTSDSQDYIYNQMINYWLEIEDPEQALLFKLRWC